jgi:hypothetical protein
VVCVGLLLGLAVGCARSDHRNGQRGAALINDFQKLDFERQQHLLLVAWALAIDMSK